MYIGSHGEELFDRSMSELMFQSVCWATCSQRISFSNGANELIAGDETTADTSTDSSENDPIRWEPGTTLEDIEEAATDPKRSVSDLMENEQRGWQLESLGIVDRDGEICLEIGSSCVQYGRIEGAEHLDPPNPQPPDRPQMCSSKRKLIYYYISMINKIESP